VAVTEDKKQEVVEFKDPIGEIELKGTKAPKTQTNFQHLLVFAARGITMQDRHLLNDLRTLLPHHRRESKFDAKKEISKMVKELCELKGCNGCLFLESRKRQDTYLWISKTESGPSVKFLVQNIHTMSELRLSGNCIKGSRPILHFDSPFSTEPHLKILKNLFMQVFGTPQGSPKTKPFVDHMICFFYLDNRIWFRHYQIVEELGTHPTTGKRQVLRSLLEIGPRFVLMPIRIFKESFGGEVLYHNPHYVSPNAIRATARKHTRLPAGLPKGIDLGALKVPETDENADLFRA